MQILVTNLIIRKAFDVKYATGGNGGIALGI